MKKVLLLFILIFLSFNSLRANDSDKWQVFKSTHFLVYYKSAPESFISKVSDKSEKCYNKIAEDLGFSRLEFWLWDDRAKIYIYDNANDYHLRTGQPLWSQGSTLPGYKIIHAFVNAKNFLETTLPHEISHIIFREFVGFNNRVIPLWLEEGVASYQEKSRYSFANQILREAMNNKEFMGLTALSNIYPKHASDSVELFYVESFSVVDFLIKKFGRDSFVSFCQYLRDGKSLDNALSLNYNYSNLADLDQAWQRYIKNE